jgi:EAL domain-containing protein (putative c-di-GMP-specific phosphodiesterase class I)
VSAEPLPLLRSTATAILSMLFQPIVDLRTEEVIGFEALARGPEGSPWERPPELFAQARLEGRLREMDWACRVAAVRDVRACSPRRPAWRLFLNTEPEVLGSSCPEDLLVDWVEGTGELSVVVEVTERALVHGAPRLLAALDELRHLGCEIALDDVGANEASVALLPLIEPDVVKLDAPLLRAGRGTVQRATLRAVDRYVERSGATLVAEGIETDGDLAAATSLGASWGQGFLFARPRPLSAGDVRVERSGGGQSRRRGPDDVLGRLDGDVPRVVVDGSWVRDHLSSFAQRAAVDAGMNVLLMHLPDSALAPEAFLRDLVALQRSAALSVVVLGEAGAGGARRHLAPVREAVEDDVVAVLLGPEVAQVMVATPAGPDRFDVIVSDRGDVVAAAARELLARSG